jgi:iron(III) transport system substrate-binding protein
MRRIPQRRPAGALIGAVAIALALAACGDDDDSSAASAPADTDASGGSEPAGGGEGSAGTLTIYSGRGEDLVGPLIEQFSEETGIEAEVRYGDSAEMLLLIQEEGENSPADVYYSQGAGFLGTLSAEGGLAPLDEALLEQVPAGLRSPDGDWVGLSGRARTVVYNTDALSEDELPDSILDFTDPEWEGRIGYAPTNASFQDFITALRALEGEEGARAWLEGILANGATPYENNIAVVEAVAAGEVDVGFVNHYYLYRFLAEDPDFPAANKFYSDGDPGALINIAGAGVVATTDRPDEAAAFIEYALSQEAQEYFAEQTFEIPVTADAEPPVELPDLESLTLPEFDLNLLLDLEGTVELLTDVGAL